MRTPWIVEVLIVDLCNKKRDSVAYYQRLDKMKQRLTYVNSYPIYWLPLQVSLVDTWYNVTNKVEEVLQPRVTSLALCNLVQLCIFFTGRIISLKNGRLLILVKSELAVPSYITEHLGFTRYGKIICDHLP